MKKRPLNPSPTLQKETGEDIHKRRCDTISEIEENGTETDKDTGASLETNIGSDGIVQYDVAIETVSNITLPNVPTDELEQRQVNIPSKTYDTTGPDNTNISGSESDCFIIDKGMNGDGSKSLLNKLKSLATKLHVQHSERADLGHSFVESDSDIETGDYNLNDHTYCNTDPQGLEAEILIGLDAAVEQGKSNQEDSNRNFLKENNQMLHLVMKTLLSVNKNIKGNSESLVNLDSRLITLEGKSEAEIAQMKSRMNQQELACDEMIQTARIERVDISSEIDIKISKVSNKISPKLSKFESKIDKKLESQKNELACHIENAVDKTVENLITSEKSKELIHGIIVEKIESLPKSQQLDSASQKQVLADLLEENLS